MFTEENETQKKGVNKVLLAAIGFGFLLVATAIYLLSLQPTMEEQKQQIMAGAFLEGSPEFEAYTKQIVIGTDTDRTTQSLIGLGTIQMNIAGTIRNKGDKTLNLLEIKIGVVDQFGKTLKEKKVIVVPLQEATLVPNQIIPVTTTIDGFKKEDDRANIRWKVTALRFQN